MSKREIVLITGGCRSGKSRIALQLSADHEPKIFVATAEPLDEEMQIRIQRHKKEREPFWITIEEPVALVEIVQKHVYGALLIDCLTLWLSNLVFRMESDEQILRSIAALRKAIKGRKGLTILITNEVGMGIVPDNELARRFRDLAGWMNQNFAELAGTVIFAISGIPLYLKKGSYEDFAN